MGSMERGGCSGISNQEDKASASPSEFRSSSSNHTQDSENKSHDSGYEEKNINEYNGNIWSNSPQSIDEGPLGSHRRFSGEKTYSKQDNRNESTTAGNTKRFGIIKNKENFEWTPYAELHLLNSLHGLRPVGANFCFYISVVHDRFNTAMGSEIPRNELIKKLNMYYNFDQALKICGEDVPTNQYAFELPKEEFPACVELMKQQKNAPKKTDADGDSKKKPRGHKK